MLIRSVVTNIVVLVLFQAFLWSATSVAGDTSDLTNSEAMFFQEWGRKYIINSTNLYEDVESVFYAFNMNGDLINEPISFIGNIIVLDTYKTIVLVHTSSHYILTESYLLDYDGRIISVVKQNPNVYDAIKTHDDRYVCFISNHVRGGVPYSKVMIVDVMGKQVASFDVSDGGVTSVNVEGRTYLIELQQPMIP